MLFRFDEADLRIGDFLAVDLVEDLLAGDFLVDGFADDFPVDVFLPEGFMAGDFLLVDFADVFLLEVLFLEGALGDFLRDDFADDFLTFCLRSRARAVPPIAAPSAAAPVAASTGFSATALTIFFAPFVAPDPTVDAASPAFSTTVDIVERPFCAEFVLWFVMRPPLARVSPRRTSPLVLGS